MSDDILKQRVHFHFQNPYRKWEQTKAFPLKLTLQLLKIFIVTIQISLFGAFRSNQSQYIDAIRQSLSHLFVKDWPGYADVHVFPPPANINSVYSNASLRDSLVFLTQQYTDLDRISLNCLMKEEDGLQMCVQQKVSGLQWRNENDTFGFVYRIHEEGSACKQVSNTVDVDAFIKTLVNRELFDAILINFHLWSFRVPDESIATRLSCHALAVGIRFENSDQSGRVRVFLNLNAEEMDSRHCFGKFQSQEGAVLNMSLLTMLDVVVVVVCVVSSLLCVRSLIRSHLLAKRVNRHLKGRMSSDDKMTFINPWYFMIVICDCFVVLGSLFKFSLDFEKYNETIFLATTMNLGIGILFVWSGVLYYLSFFPRYNVMIATMKKSFPMVLRFLLVAGLIYVGFVLCGWIVLGPYSIKFADPFVTSACLFSFLQGDSVFITFYTITNAKITWFAQIYLYTFGLFFVLVVASVFNMIILGAYSTIAEVSAESSPEESSAMNQFLRK